MTKLYLGIDVGGTSIKSGVVDEGAPAHPAGL